MSTITEGRHKATVVAATVGESSQNKTPGVFIDFQLEGGADIRGTLWLTDKQFTIKSGKRAGQTSTPYEETLNTLREVFGFNDDFATIHDQLEGRACSVVIEHEADQKDPTKFWPRVKWINAANAGPKPVAPVDNSLLARLSRQAKAVARPADAPAPQPKAAPKPAPAAQAEGDPY